MLAGLLGTLSGEVVDLAKHRRKVERARARKSRSRPELVHPLLKDVILKAGREVGLRNLDLGKLLASVAEETGVPVEEVRTVLHRDVLSTLVVRLDSAKYMLDLIDHDDEP